MLLNTWCLTVFGRDALRKKLEEDRRERRRKLGLPEELTEEEKARDAEKERAKAEQELKRHVFIKPVSGTGEGVCGGSGRMGQHGSMRLHGRRKQGPHAWEVGAW